MGMLYEYVKDAFKVNQQFRELFEAMNWCMMNAHGPCTVIVQGYPYELKIIDYEIGPREWLLRQKFPLEYLF